MRASGEVTAVDSWHSEERMTTDDPQRALDDLHATIALLLPETYQASYETLQPVSMRSAGLVYDDDGRVAWDRIWGGFCDLAMAGGPPHKGRLLEPATREAVDAAPERYDEVTWEIRRGITMATDLRATASMAPGWVDVDCYSDAMAAWLVRAIVMENVAATADGRRLRLPARPDFRLEKEIKNVVTVIAKTSHYWLGHIMPPQQYAIGQCLATLAATAPVVAPVWLPDGSDPSAGVTAALVDRLHAVTGVGAASPRQAGWLGVACPDVASAVWMTRGLVAMNVLARREDMVLCVPVNISADPQGDRVAAAIARVHHLAVARGVLTTSAPSSLL
jgi:sirohydrochlorin cobaltochelatase